MAGPLVIFARYVNKNYMNPVVAIHGYDTPFTKVKVMSYVLKVYWKHKQSSKGYDLLNKKAKFLKNSLKKQNFLRLLSKAMREEDINADMSADADALIS